MGTGNKVIYLFCFAKEALLPKIDTVEIESLGIKPGLSVISKGEVAAVHGFVPLEDFTGPDSESRLRDLEWIGPRAIFHEKVVEEISRYSPVYPVPFGTIFLSNKNLGNFTREHLKTLSGFLDYVSDKSEWAVKAYSLPDQGRKKIMEKMQREWEKKPLSPGMRYLHEQRLRGSISDKYRGWLDEVLTDARQSLSHIAAEVRERTPFSDSGVDPPAEMAANWALLVHKENGNLLATTVDALNERYREEGLLFRLSGPWPPFSFTPPLNGGGETSR